MNGGNFDPDLHANLRIWIFGTVGISTVMLPLMLYLIFTQSHMMLKYRWYLLNTMSEFFERGRSVYFMYLIVHISLYCGLPLVMFIGQLKGVEETRALFLADNPDLLAYADRPILCFANNEKTEIFHLSVASWYVAVLCLGFVLHGLLIREVLRTKHKSMIKSTFELQFMLLKALTCQLILGFFFLLVPFLLQIMLNYYQVCPLTHD
ncbi:hypothetical protein M3Y99_01795900 [Aphelenchoides fujianensis]|nr:hypothetical protein M3Y99_01795900 [Aphelenchoides fujianensis]